MLWSDSDALRPERERRRRLRLRAHKRRSLIAKSALTTFSALALGLSLWSLRHMKAIEVARQASAHGTPSDAIPHLIGNNTGFGAGGMARMEEGARKLVTIAANATVVGGGGVPGEALSRLPGDAVSLVELPLGAKDVEQNTTLPEPIAVVANVPEPIVALDEKVDSAPMSELAASVTLREPPVQAQNATTDLHRKAPVTDGEEEPATVEEKDAWAVGSVEKEVGDGVEGGQAREAGEGGEEVELDSLDDEEGGRAPVITLPRKGADEEEGGEEEEQ